MEIFEPASSRLQLDATQPHPDIHVIRDTPPVIKSRLFFMEVPTECRQPTFQAYRHLVQRYSHLENGPLFNMRLQLGLESEFGQQYGFQRAAIQENSTCRKKRSGEMDRRSCLQQLRLNYFLFAYFLNVNISLD